MCILIPHSPPQCQKKNILCVQSKTQPVSVRSSLKPNYEIIVATSNFRLNQFFDIQPHSTEQCECNRKDFCHLNIVTPLACTQAIIWACPAAVQPSPGTFRRGGAHARPPLPHGCNPERPTCGHGTQRSLKCHISQGLEFANLRQNPAQGNLQCSHQ